MLERETEVRNQEAELAQVNHEIATATEELRRAQTESEREATACQMARTDLGGLDHKLDELKVESKTCMGRLRDEEELREDLLRKKALLEEQVRKLSQQETQLNGHSHHL